MGIERLKIDGNRYGRIGWRSKGRGEKDRTMTIKEAGYNAPLFQSVVL
jgi:hypothetical protein